MNCLAIYRPYIMFDNELRENEYYEKCSRADYTKCPAQAKYFALGATLIVSYKVSSSRSTTSHTKKTLDYYSFKDNFL